MIDLPNNFTKYRLGINFGFVQEKFYVQYQKIQRPVLNLREEFDKRAIELFEMSKNLMLGISSGLDSQAVMHSFITQGLDIDYAFLYFPGYNDIEFQHLKILQKKYGFQATVVDINPYKVKDEVLHLSETLDFPYSQILHRLFLEKLPLHVDFIQGIHGPDLYLTKKTQQWMLLESAGSAEICRLRSFLSLERTGKIIGWERIPEILLSILQDDVTQAFMRSYQYISENKLIYENGEKIPVIDSWDLYMKPFLYGKYWKNELEYFPKYVGYELIDYVYNGPKHKYRENLVLIGIEQLIHDLQSVEYPKKFYENFVLPSIPHE